MQAGRQAVAYDDQDLYGDRNDAKLLLEGISTTTEMHRHRPSHLLATATAFPRVLASFPAIFPQAPQRHPAIKPGSPPSVAMRCEPSQFQSMVELRVGKSATDTGYFMHESPETVHVVYVLLL